MKPFWMLLTLILLCFLIGSCAQWRWKECRQVGHGVAYCVWVVSKP